MCLVSPTLTSAHTPSDQEKPWPVPEFTIMPIGRWSSDAFLQYICRQVLQFSAGVSKCMISTQSQDFFTLPEFDPEHPHTQAHQTNFQYSPQQNAFHSRPCIRIPPPMVQTLNLRNIPLHITPKTRPITSTITSWRDSWPRFWDQVIHGMKIPTPKHCLHITRLLDYCYTIREQKAREWTGFELCLSGVLI
jgi:hypothetical protein